MTFTTSSPNSLPAIGKSQCKSCFIAKHDYSFSSESIASGVVPTVDVDVDEIRSKWFQHMDAMRGECSSGRYGMNCQFTCGKCKTSESCDTVTGRCIGGCLDGFQGHLCKEALPQKTYVLAITTGILFLLFVMSVFVIIKLVLRKRSKPTETRVTFSTVKCGIEKPATAVEVTVSDSVYDVCDDKQVEGLSTQTEPATTGEHDYQNASQMAENNQTEINTYEKLDVDVTGELSPYEKINV
ncbi:uncharacterized protein LOC121391773 [Gigantopelta aegis]|uniref:uncharacterized protein LOC121391773 n=1 Tax=Gigantopelta aegis TaxID=1735272 RepID=UPI001B88C2A6|nr:uncharacterized protein LOC121391773 [Gigantopelta aegis]